MTTRQGRPVESSNTAPTDELLAFWGSEPFLDTLSEGLVLHGRHGVIVEANQRALELLGLSRDQLLGHTSFDPKWGAVRSDGSALPGDEHPAMITLATGEDQTDVTMGIDTPDGPRRWLSVSSSLIRDHAGVAIGVSATFLDVTTRHRAFTEVVELEQRYEALAENSSDIVTVGSLDGTLTWISRSITRLLGWTPSQVTERPFTDLVHHDDLRRVREVSSELSAGTRRALTIRLRAHDGSFHWFAVALRDVVDDRTGQITRIGSLRLADDLIAATMALEASERRFRLLIESAADLICETNGDGIITWITPSAASLLGWNPDDPVGTRGVDLIHLDDRERAVAALRDVQLHGERASLEIRLVSEEGIERWMLVSAVPTEHGAGLTIGFTNIDDLVAERLARQETEDLYRLIVENESDVVIQVDLEATIQWISPSIINLTGRRPEQMIGHRADEFVFPGDTINLAHLIDEVVDGASRSMTLRVQHATRGFRWVAARVRPIISESHEVSGAVVNLHDVHDEVLAQEALAQSEERFRLTLESTPIGMAVEDLDRKFIMVNPKLCDMLDRDAQWLIHHRVSDVLEASDDRADLQRRADLLAGKALAPWECRLTGADQATIWVEHSVGVLRDPEGIPVSYVSTYVDITQTKQAKEKLAYQATHDILTHLVNRRDLFVRAQGITRRAQRSGERVAILYIDVDNLKVINDTASHAAGDQVLVAVAERLTSSCRSDDIVSRIGGDEFAILLTGLHSIGDAEMVADKILATFAEPVEIEGTPTVVSVSIGIAMAERGEETELTLRHADLALYAAKDAGRGRAVSYLASEPE